MTESINHKENSIENYLNEQRNYLPADFNSQTINVGQKIVELNKNVNKESMSENKATTLLCSSSSSSSTSSTSSSNSSTKSSPTTKNSNSNALSSPTATSKLAELVQPLSNNSNTAVNEVDQLRDEIIKLATTVPSKTVQDINNSNKCSNKKKSSPSCSTSSSSSVIAALSILSFSGSSNSTSSLSSTVSYGDPACLNSSSLNNLSYLTRQIGNSSNILNKTMSSLPSDSLHVNTTNVTLSNTTKQSKTVNAQELSELLAPYVHKKFYGKEWFFKKLADFLANENTKILSSLSSAKKTASCLLVIGETGTGKTHLCCELKWPTLTNNSSFVLNNSIRLNERILNVYFLNVFNQKQNHLKQFYSHLSKTLQDFVFKHFDSCFKFKNSIDLKLEEFLDEDLINEEQLFEANECTNEDEDDEIEQKSNQTSDFISNSDEIHVNMYSAKFIQNILLPLKDLTIKREQESNKSFDDYIFIIDGIDDAILQSERLLKMNETSNQNTTQSRLGMTEMILLFLNKTFPFFPHWLNLLLTSTRYTEKVYLRKFLVDLKYEKLSMDKCAVNPNTTMLAKYKSTTSSNEHLNRETESSVRSPSHSINASTAEHSSISSSNIKSANRLSIAQPIANLSSNHFANLRDIQCYILKRLDNDLKLKQKLVQQKNSIEMLNLLLIKSNYCVLYVEKIFQFLLNDLIDTNEIKQIPATLNGLYLYLIERIVSNLEKQSSSRSSQTPHDSLRIEEEPQVSKKELLFLIFGFCLAEFSSINKEELFQKLKLKHANLGFEYYESLFDYIEPFLFTKRTYQQCARDNQQPRSNQIFYCLFHSSFIDWFTDVKFCTNKYMINLKEAHFDLANFYFNRLSAIKQQAKVQNDMQPSKTELLNKKSPQFKRVWSKFKYHLAKSCGYLGSNSQLDYYYILCESEFELKAELNSLNRKLFECKHNSVNMKSSESKSKLINDSKRSKIDYDQIFNSFDSALLRAPRNEQLLFDLVSKGDLQTIKRLVSNESHYKYYMNTIVDSFNQSLLLVSVKLNNIELVEYLLQFKPYNLDHCDSSGWTALRYSAWMGNEQLVSILLENGADIDASDSDGRTALRAAVFSGHENIVKLLLKYGANVNKCDIEQRSVLQVAIYMGHCSIVGCLLSSGANVNHEDLIGRGMLSTAIYTTNKRSQLDMIKLLIKHGAQLEQLDKNNQTPLILAAQENQQKCVELLLNSGADIDAIDSQQYTPLTHAVKNKFNELVDYLLNNRNAATHILDKDGRSILSISCAIGAEKIVRMLMNRDLDEMHRDNNGWTPLHEATYNEHLNICVMLLNYGSEIDACDNNGKTCLYMACEQANLDLVKLFISRNANINAKSHEGTSPFRVACLRNHVPISEYLLEACAEINYKDADGRTTLFCLISANEPNMKMIEFLLKKGASVHLKDHDGLTCLHLACSRGLEYIVRLLLKYNANKEAVDKNGNTPLLTATRNEHPNIVKMLLKEKVYLNHQDRQGATALSIACQKGNIDIVKELLQHGAYVFASSCNPIKLANQYGYSHIVQLLQQYSTNCCPSPMSPCAPKSSISFDSFRSNKVNMASNRLSHVPNGQFSYVLPVSISSYDSTNFGAAADSQNECEDTLSNLNSIKVSRFKQVKDKLFRRSISIDEKKANSSFLASTTSIDYNSSIQDTSSLFSYRAIREHQVTTASPSSNKIDKVNCSSMQDDQKSDAASITYSIEIKNKRFDSIKNNGFVKLIKRKFKNLVGQSNSSLNKSNCNTGSLMQRSKTDSLATVLTSEDCSLASKSLWSYQLNSNDDVAHIFNRDSLNDCLNPKRSFKDLDIAAIKNSKSFPSQAIDEMSEIECNQSDFSSFKKETSI